MTLAVELDVKQQINLNLNPPSGGYVLGVFICLFVFVCDYSKGIGQVFEVFFCAVRVLPKEKVI